MSQKVIDIKGARVHNLKNLSVKIPHGKMTVITGISGSGKSSLAFDTLYAEGQRRYIESLSSYARQFLGKLDKPEADYIKGVAPAIAIQQKVISSNPRSTVGTTTEIYDYLKILYARGGTTYSPVSGEIVKSDSVGDVLTAISELDSESFTTIACPLKDIEKYGRDRILNLLKEQGFRRLIVGTDLVKIEDLLLNSTELDDSLLVIDRVSNDLDSEDNRARAGDSIAIAFAEGNGDCIIIPEIGERRFFSNRFERDGMEFQEPSPHFFTFNNPFGACKRCEGYGSIIGIDQKLVIPDKELSVYEGAVVAWNGERMAEYKDRFIRKAAKINFPIHRSIAELSEKELEILWHGDKGIDGIAGFFEYVESKAYKIQYRVMLSRYRGKSICPDCKGTRLRKDASYVKIVGKSIIDIVLLPIHEALAFFEDIQKDIGDDRLSKRILPEIINRLTFLNNVGLGYLTLNRASNSLSGGESQRINLATSLGSSLVGSMYILDEPSIGLHPRDTEKLIGVLHKLRDLGNTVIIVEHEEDIMRAADEILDIGPEAGIYGGSVVFQGNHSELLLEEDSLTAQYLNHKLSIPVPEQRRKWTNSLEIFGARQFNLKNIDVRFPLNTLTCVTGVSGSGKSTLVRELLVPLVRKELGIFGEAIGEHRSFKGDFKMLKALEFIDQNPIGKSSRSNPVTYVKAFDDIRELFSRQALSKMRAYKPGFFSFNVEGGRCEICEGEGEITVSMQFMADVHLTCETCNGSRYKSETLEVVYNGCTIADILNMDIQSAYTFFKDGTEKIEEKIAEKIEPLIRVGLGYLKLGQASSTLSGGEAQRIKLASFLAKGNNTPPTLFVFDEPTTGLHFHDIQKLIIAVNELINKGHSVVIIEHDPDVIKCADYVIDLGPDGGDLGGQLIFQGTPEDLVKIKESATGHYLKAKLQLKNNKLH
jgi:excinuclease ABC subunit A